MVYQRKQRAYEQEPLQVPQVQNDLFASPDVETEEADTAYVAPGPTAAPNWEAVQRQIDNPLFDFGKISILPPDSALQRQPVDPSTLSKRERFIQRAFNVQREPVISSMPGPPGPLDYHFAAPQREDGLEVPLAHPLAIQRQAKTADQGIAQSGTVNLTPQGSGRPLPKQVSDPFVQSGYPEVQQARVHVDDAATQSIQAKAYTQKNNIVVQSSGANDPKLLGHEATHVVQQSQMALKPDVNGTPINANPALEQNADDNGERVARHESVSVKGASAQQATPGQKSSKVVQPKASGQTAPSSGIIQRKPVVNPKKGNITVLSKKHVEKLLKSRYGLTKSQAETFVEDWWGKAESSGVWTLKEVYLVAKKKINEATHNNPAGGVAADASVIGENEASDGNPAGGVAADVAVIDGNGVDEEEEKAIELNEDKKAEIDDENMLSQDELKQHGQPIDFGQAQIKGLEPEEKDEKADINNNNPKNQEYLKIYQSKNKYFEIQNHEIPAYFKAIYQVHPNPEFLDMTSEKLMRRSTVVAQQKVNPTPHFWSTGVDPDESAKTDYELGRLLPVVWPEDIPDKSNMVVSRGDTRPPWDSSLKGGFKPWSRQKETRYSKNLYRHVARTPSPDDSAYVSTTIHKRTAKRFANGGYSYHFKAQKGIYVPQIFPEFSEEGELAVPGVIPPKEIVSVKTDKNTIEGEQLQQIIEDKAWDHEISEKWSDCEKSGYNPKMTWKEYLGVKNVKPRLGEYKDKEDKGNEENKEYKGRPIAKRYSAKRQEIFQAMQQRNSTKEMIDKYGKSTIFQAIAWSQNYGYIQFDLGRILERLGIDLVEEDRVKKLEKVGGKLKDILDKLTNNKLNQKQTSMSAEDAALIFYITQRTIDSNDQLEEIIAELKEEKRNSKESERRSKESERRLKESERRLKELKGKGGELKELKELKEKERKLKLEDCLPQLLISDFIKEDIKTGHKSLLTEDANIFKQLKDGTLSDIIDQCMVKDSSPYDFMKKKAQQDNVDLQEEPADRLFKYIKMYSDTYWELEKEKRLREKERKLRELKERESELIGFKENEEKLRELKEKERELERKLALEKSSNPKQEILKFMKEDIKTGHKSLMTEDANIFKQLKDKTLLDIIDQCKNEHFGDFMQEKAQKDNVDLQEEPADRLFNYIMMYWRTYWELKKESDLKGKERKSRELKERKSELIGFKENEEKLRELKEKERKLERKLILEKSSNPKQEILKFMKEDIKTDRKDLSGAYLFSKADLFSKLEKSTLLKIINKCKSSDKKPHKFMQDEAQGNNGNDGVTLKNGHTAMLYKYIRYYWKLAKDNRREKTNKVLAATPKAKKEEKLDLNFPLDKSNVSKKLDFVDANWIAPSDKNFSDENKEMKKEEKLDIDLPSDAIKALGGNHQITQLYKEVGQGLVEDVYKAAYEEKINEVKDLQKIKQIGGNKQSVWQFLQKLGDQGKLKTVLDPLAYKDNKNKQPWGAKVTETFKKAYLDDMQLSLVYLDNVEGKALSKILKVNAQVFSLRGQRNGDKFVYWDGHQYHRYKVEKWTPSDKNCLIHGMYLIKRGEIATRDEAWKARRLIAEEINRGDLELQLQGYIGDALEGLPLAGGLGDRTKALLESNDKIRQGKDEKLKQLENSSNVNSSNVNSSNVNSSNVNSLKGNQVIPDGYQEIDLNATYEHSGNEKEGYLVFVNGNHYVHVVPEGHHPVGLGNNENHNKSKDNKNKGKKSSSEIEESKKSQSKQKISSMELFILLTKIQTPEGKSMWEKVVAFKGKIVENQISQIEEYMERYNIGAVTYNEKLVKVYKDDLASQTGLKDLIKEVYKDSQ